MALYKERERAIENEFFHRDSVAFKTMVQRTKLFGQRIADEMGLEESAADEYYRSLVELYVDTRCDDDLVDRVICDLHEIGVAEHRYIIEAKLRQAAEEASF